jgi:hypothetical protein
MTRKKYGKKKHIICDGIAGNSRENITFSAFKSDNIMLLAFH